MESYSTVAGRCRAQGGKAGEILFIHQHACGRKQKQEQEINLSQTFDKYWLRQRNGNAIRNGKLTHKSIHMFTHTNTYTGSATFTVTILLPGGIMQAAVYFMGRLRRQEAAPTLRPVGRRTVHARDRFSFGTNFQSRFLCPRASICILLRTRFNCQVRKHCWGLASVPPTVAHLRLQVVALVGFTRANYDIFILKLWSATLTWWY